MVAVKILHFSDIHVWDLEGFWSDGLYFKRLLGLVNLQLKRRHRFPRQFGESVVRHLLGREADLVVFSGDLTTLSSESEFRRIRDLLAPLREKWGDRLFVIPGNHDRYSPRSVRAGLYEKYFADDAFPGGVGVRSLETDSSHPVVVGLDNSRPFMVRSNGVLTKTVEANLRSELQRHAEAGRPVILVGHYPYATPAGIHESWEHRLIGAERLARLIAEFRPLLYLHGHLHHRWLIRPESTPDTICVDSGSAGMRSSDPRRQAGYVALELDSSAKLVGAQAWVLGEQGRFDCLELPPATAP